MDRFKLQRLFESKLQIENVVFSKRRSCKQQILYNKHQTLNFFMFIKCLLDKANRINFISSFKSETTKIRTYTFSGYCMYSYMYAHNYVLHIIFYCYLPGLCLFIYSSNVFGWNFNTFFARICATVTMTIRQKKKQLNKTIIIVN